MVGRQSLRRPAQSTRRDLLWLGLILCSALLVRIYPSLSVVFTGDRVVFQGNDSWYHLRLIDHMVANFPQRMTFDPYAFFPAGMRVDVAPLFDFLVASTAWILGLGSPSERMINVVAAFMPPVLGALTVPLVYAIGKHLFDRLAGLLASAFLAVLPGQFLLRSRLGFADHHVLETLLSTLTIWLLLRTLAQVDSKPLGEDARRSQPRWRALLPASMWPGLALGAYLLTWSGGAMFVAILIVWSAVRMTLDHLRGRSVAYVPCISISIACIAFLTLSPFLTILARLQTHLAALALLALTPAALLGLQELFVRKGLPRTGFPFAAATLASAGGLLSWWLFPSVVGGVLSFLGRWAPDPTRWTVLEAKPMFFGAGLHDLSTLWTQHRLLFLIGAGAWLLLLPGTLRRARKGHVLFMVWSLGMLVATYGQNRFGYYLDINLCLLLAWSCRRILGPLDRRFKGQRPPIGRLLASTVIMTLALLPMIRPTLEMARQNTGPSPGWFEALDWLRQNTPEPLRHRDAYAEVYSTPTDSLPFSYPEDAYGVMSWWDFGYWILRIGRRIPNANPTQLGAQDAARFFTATEETEALPILERLGTRYVLVNAERGVWTRAEGSGFVPLMAVWTERPSSDFVGLYWTPLADGNLEKKVLYHPDYYRSLFTRLHLYGGRGWTPRGTTWVISFEEREVPGGVLGRVITQTLFFETYEAGFKFLAERPDPERWRIVSPDPLLSCVPLKPMERLRQVSETSASVAVTGNLRLPEIRIFELLPEAR